MYKKKITANYVSLGSLVVEALFWRNKDGGSILSRGIAVSCKDEKMIRKNVKSWVKSNNNVKMSARASGVYKNKKKKKLGQGWIVKSVV